MSEEVQNRKPGKLRANLEIKPKTLDLVQMDADVIYLGTSLYVFRIITKWYCLSCNTNLYSKQEINNIKII